ncbi:hypothetical protein [Streptomyces smaragdinus]|nr:hypothetical protein [Streptomyces smaragdinus]
MAGTRSDFPGLQIFSAASPFAVAMFAAAVDAGQFPRGGRRILVVTKSPAPLSGMPGFDELGTRFDAVVTWDDVVAPLSPAHWRVRGEDVPVWERQLRRWWELGEEPAGLVLDGLTGQSLALARIFASAQLTVCAGGAEAYGATPAKVARTVGLRVRRLLHLGLLPGTSPLYLSEFGVPASALPASAVRDVMPSVPLPGGVPSGDSALLVAPTEEELCELLLLARAAGYGPVVALGTGRLRALERAAREQSAPLTVLEPPYLVESVCAALRPAALFTPDATLLLRARALYGVTPVLHPAHTSAEPLAAAAASAPPDPPALAALAGTLAYVHQPRVYPALRAQATAYLRTTRVPSLPRRRLIALGLPGGAPAPLRPLLRTSTVPRAARAVLRNRTVRRSAKRLLASSGAARKVARRVKGL